MGLALRAAREWVVGRVAEVRVLIELYVVFVCTIMLSVLVLLTICSAVIRSSEANTVEIFNQVRPFSFLFAKFEK